MKVLLAIFIGLSLPNLALANLPITRPSVIMMWWSFFFTVAFIAFWLLIVLFIFIIQRVKAKKFVLPRWMKMGMLLPVIVLIVGAGFGQYQDRVQTRKDNQCVLDCLQCAPGSQRAQVVQWGGRVVSKKCEPWGNTCENWHTCAMMSCGFEPIRPIEEYCPR